jgi:hypothetical protein
MSATTINPEEQEKGEALSVWKEVAVMITK